MIRDGDSGFNLIQMFLGIVQQKGFIRTENALIVIWVVHSHPIIAWIERSLEFKGIVRERLKSALPSITHTIV